MMPACTIITPFDFDHGYRFAHISRNLWWTDSGIFHEEVGDEAVYFSNRQWLLQRKKGYFFAVKGGNNNEQHNHNDSGNFVLAIDGEQFIADLGAGRYTADYFGEKRYELVHTRSRYHNLPLIGEQEQIATPEECQVEHVAVEGEYVGITMELGMFYFVPELTSLKRSFVSDMSKGNIILKDEVRATKEITVEESFMTYIRPSVLKDGEIIIQGEKGQLSLSYDYALLEYYLEELTFENHYSEQVTAYRMSFLMKEKRLNTSMEFLFTYN